MIARTLPPMIAEARASAIIGGQVRAIISPHPELGFDVDKLEDLRAAEAAASSP